MKTPMIALAAVASLLAGSPALAEGPQRTARVSYDDLNLSSEAGQKALERRIDRAARKVCQVGEPRSGTRLKSPEARECYAKALRSATRQVAEITSDSQKGG